MTISVVYKFWGVSIITTNQALNFDGEIFDGDASDNPAFGDGPVSYNYTLNGNDFVGSSGNFNDQVHTGGGDDFISTGDGDDEIYGDGGDDEIRGDNGNDLIYGWTGDDSILAGAGTDTVSGGAGDDEIDLGPAGTSGRERASGDGGDDLILGSNQSDDILGGAGSDVLVGLGGGDLIRGGAGADVIVLWGTGDSTIADPDTVRDFRHNDGDLINIGDLGSDFVYRGQSAFSGAQNQIRVVSQGSNLRVEFNLDNDRAAEAAIVLAQTKPGDISLADFDF